MRPRRRSYAQKSRLELVSPRDRRVREVWPSLRNQVPKNNHARQRNDRVSLWRENLQPFWCGILPGHARRSFRRSRLQVDERGNEARDTLRHARQAARYRGVCSRRNWDRGRLVLPSPFPWRVGGHNFAFEACSSFTRVTACRVARPPYSGLCHEASTRPVTQPGRSLATMFTDNYMGGSSPHW